MDTSRIGVKAPTWDAGIAPSSLGRVLVAPVENPVLVRGHLVPHAPGLIFINARAPAAHFRSAIGVFFTHNWNCFLTDGKMPLVENGRRASHARVQEALTYCYEFRQS